MSGYETSTDTQETVTQERQQDQQGIQQRWRGMGASVWFLQRTLPSFLLHWFSASPLTNNHEQSSLTKHQQCIFSQFRGQSVKSRHWQGPDPAGGSGGERFLSPLDSGILGSGLHDVILCLCLNMVFSFVSMLSLIRSLVLGFAAHLGNPG